MKNESLKIKRKILIPLTGIIIVMLTIMIVGISKLKEREIEINIINKEIKLEQAYKKIIETNRDEIKTIFNFILNNKQIKNAFLEKNREALFDLSKPIFDSLKKNNKITHFYFTDINRINFLRVHKKEKYGDLINRQTMIASNKQNTLSSGVELGPLGTFTLRVVAPWFVENKLIGYIELGEEIKDIIPSLKINWDFEYSFVLNNDNQLNKNLIQSSFFNNIESISKTVTKNDNTFVISHIDLKDMNNNNIGKIYFPYNISKINSEYSKIMLKTILITLIISSLIFVLLVPHLKKLENIIKNENSNNQENKKKLDYHKKLLKDANEFAETAILVKNKFLSKVSYDLRTPLNGITGFLQLLAGTELDEKQKECTKFIELNSKHLLDSIERLLDFSKLEANDMQIENYDFNLKDLIENVIPLHKQKCESQKLKFDLNIEDAVPLVLSGDNYRTMQIVNNLLSNAIKYTQKGNISLTIKKEDEDKKTITLSFIVKDSGIGISKTNKVKILSAFEQVDNAQSNNLGGLGLGLSIAQSLISLMKGKLELETEVGEGSTFTATIPFKKSYINKDQKITSNINRMIIENETPIIKIEDAKILIVEDSTTYMMITKIFLEELNYKDIDTARNGEIALEKIEKKDYDLIFMDCLMPIMDGFEATEIIRKLDNKNSTVPIIAVTANVMPSDKVKCTRAGMNDFIEKPIKQERFKEVLTHYFK